MELVEYIDKVKIENNISFDTKDIKKYIEELARKMANGKNCIGISDEDVKQWIIEFTPEDLQKLGKSENKVNKEVEKASQNAKKMETASRVEARKKQKTQASSFGMEPLF